MYDVIGDIHGCRKEMKELLQKLGYKEKDGKIIHSANRKPVFLGDLTDRGPDSLGVVQDVAAWVGQGDALYCPGNHCDKLYRYFLGRNVQITHGLETTIAEWKAAPGREQKKIQHTFKQLYEQAPLYLVLAGGNLVAAHAGIRHRDIGRTDKRIKSFVLYGDVTGATDEKGLPERLDWPSLYPQGKEKIVYGHTPVAEPRIIGNTINIDTGCIFGGKLTAYRYPEEEFVSVPSAMPLAEEKFRDFS
ncbi:bis(5'-nucleosyl)-tetraphosphatase PrpE [Alkalicoccus daliensis]|uniref:Protein phosphatase n=1 Tax=Alkalicoccus daliensis TaxID=745820 RepID=A0A1G9ZH08_9BACI|nr:bis(5'-nucleosyl)-tetraphosphatase PrpE [Alkalicoccus daliensis]SDN20445.1 protein phosphatase [Alkalicoccus daliensis]